MIRAHLVRFASLASLVLAFGACLLFARAAEAKYVPPPAPAGHCVTTVGWLSPSDIRKIDEESEIAKTQTGFVIDVLLAPSDEPIDEIATETFKAWQPGDPAKGNGLLLVVQPNFPRGQRKVRLSVGPGVEAKIPASKGKELLVSVLGPLINSDSDQIRTALAAGVMEIAKRLGADESKVVPLDVVLPATADAGGFDASGPAISEAARQGSPITAPRANASAPASAGSAGSSEKGESGGMGVAVGVATIIVLGGLIYWRTRRT